MADNPTLYNLNCFVIQRKYKESWGGHDPNTGHSTIGGREREGAVHIYEGSIIQYMSGPMYHIYLVDCVSCVVTVVF